MQTDPELPAEAPKLEPIPPWAWLFAVACFAIPVVAIGGAIPTALGVGGGLGCLTLARQPALPVHSRILRSAALTASCWGGFILLAVIVVSAAAETTSGTSPKKSSKSIQADLTDEAARRKLFDRATMFLDNLERADQDLVEDRAKGRKTDFAERRIEHLEGMHASQLESVARSAKITKAQLEGILQEGFSKGWPVD